MTDAAVAPQETPKPIFDDGRVPEYKVGDPVWIHISKVSSPAGWWHAEVTEVYAENGFPRYRVVFTDTRLKGQDDYEGTITSRYHGQSPNTFQFSLYPRNKYTDDLIRDIQRIEERAQRDARDARIREEAIVDALSRVTARDLTKDEVRAAVLEKKP